MAAMENPVEEISEGKKRSFVPTWGRGKNVKPSAIDASPANGSASGQGSYRYVPCLCLPEVILTNRVLHSDNAPLSCTLQDGLTRLYIPPQSTCSAITASASCPHVRAVLVLTEQTIKFWYGEGWS